MVDTHHKYKIAHLVEIGKPLQIDEIEAPQLKENEVLIKVESAPINPSDQSYLKGHYGHIASLPAKTGFEGSGIVIKAGSNKGEGLIGKKVGFSATGSYSQIASAELTRVWPMPENVDFNQAACSFVNPLTVVGMLDVVQKQHQGKTVIANAAASQLVRQMNRLFHDYGIKVINIVRRPEQIEIMKKEGAQIILNENDANFEADFKKAVEEHKPNVFFDAVVGPTASKILSLLPPQSTHYVYGGLSGQPLTVSPAPLFKGTIISCFSLPTWIQKQTPEDLQKAVHLVISHLNTHLRSEISKEFKLSEINEALDYYSKNMTAGKVIIKPQ